MVVWWEAVAVAVAAAAAGTGGSSATVVSICVFTAVLCLCLIAGHLLEENKWVNESITALIIGCIIGAIIFLISKGSNSHIARFDEQLFFIYDLPPIIFNAGFQVKKKQFFHNFMTIMSFGVFSVFISVAIVSAGCYWLFPKVGYGKLEAVDYLALGAILSSTDTVCTLQVINQDETPRLYSLVFGEGVVNDATAVVLFNAIKNLDISKLKGRVVLKVVSDFLNLFATSTILGISVVKYINNAEARPSVFVSATAIGYYGTSKIHTFDESSPSGNDYLAEVCREWEARAREVNQKDVRLVLLRIGVVLGKDGGALAKMIPLFMMFAGGPLGTGLQWFSWIHLDDLVNLIYESLTNPAYKGHPI